MTHVMAIRCFKILYPFYGFRPVVHRSIDIQNKLSIFVWNGAITKVPQAPIDNV